MKTQDFRNLDSTELIARITQLTSEYYGLVEQVQQGKEKNHARLRNLRRDIARAKTVYAEKERASLAR